MPRVRKTATEGRRLAAIMFTDLAGYTALTQRNEALAMQLLEEHRRLVRPIFPKHNGREVKTIGDAFLVEFGSALEATRCAFDIQQSLNEVNSSRPEDRRVLARIGIHLGDVIHDQNDVYGDAVNIASRIEPLASPGGICVSEQVYSQIKNKFEFPLSTLGEKTLKNVSEAVEVFRVVLPWEKKSESESSLEKTRIAVLPFTNMSPDPNDEYFADGMTEELIDALAQVKSLKVIARTSVMSYKKKEKKASEIARELEVGTLVEGSVRKAGNRVRVTVQLINAGTEEHLWSSHYDKDLNDIFAVQSEIAEKVAGELRIRLVDSERKTLEKKPTENTEAYTYFLRGRELAREETEPSLRQAVGLLEKAVELDPSFAKAYAGLAQGFLHLANDIYEPYEKAIPKAELFVKKALALDPELAEAVAALAEIHFLEDDVVACENEAKRATELNPSLPEAHRLLYNVATISGDGDQGIRLLEAAYHLDPVRPMYIERLGSAYFYMGRENEALEFWKKTAQLAPAGTYRNMTEYYLYKGDIEKARELHSMAEKLEPTNPWVTWMRGFIAAQKGDRVAALQAIRKIEEDWSGAVDLNGLAYVHYALGDLDSYFTYINRATDQHLLQYWYVMYCPLLAKARTDSRYLLLMEKTRKNCGLTK